MIKETTGGITLIPENIPDQLTERPQWVCWRYEERDGKPTKVPYTPGTGWKASTTDLTTWGKFPAAWIPGIGKACGPPHYDGIGFVLSSGDPFVGIDIDDCRDPETGEITPQAKKIIDRVREGYVEVSPSGTGVHIIVEGRFREGGVRKGKVEMYSRDRFFTITGEVL